MTSRLPSHVHVHTHYRKTEGKNERENTRGDRRLGDIRGGRKTMGAKGRRRRKGEKKDKGEGEPLCSELVVQLWPQAPLGKTPSLSQLGLASRSRGQGFTGPSSLWRKGGRALNGGFHLCQVTSCLQLTKLPRRRRGGLGGLVSTIPRTIPLQRWHLFSPAASCLFTER